MTVIEIDSLDDPRLADYSHQTDVALKKAQGTEHGLYIAESALVLGRALRAGHRPRSVLALGSSVRDALQRLTKSPPPVPAPARREGRTLLGLTGSVGVEKKFSGQACFGH